MLMKKPLLLGIIFILTIAGFVLGQAVSAAIGSPGTQSDPLVTQSYVNGEAAKIQSQIDSLKADVEKVKADLENLKTK